MKRFEQSDTRDEEGTRRFSIKIKTTLIMIDVDSNFQTRQIILIHEYRHIDPLISISTRRKSAFVEKSFKIFYNRCEKFTRKDISQNIFFDV